MRKIIEVKKKQLKKYNMNYSDYIKLGFTREDITDNVEFNEHGYHGFILSKKIIDDMSIEVTAFELDNPKLYIKKENRELYNIISINDDMVRDLCNR